MAGKRSAALALGLLVCALPARAGLYSSAEPFEQPLSPDYRQFRDTLIKLWNIENTNPQVSPTPLSKRYLQVKEQMAGGIPGNLTIGERIDLGAALIRLRRYEEAIQVMKPGAIQDRGNFLLLANLATAYYLAGQEAQAVDAVQLALDAWPPAWAKLGKERQLLLPLQLGWDENQFTWYRQVETYYRKLLRLRLRESLKRPGPAGQPADDLDNLFDVRFVGEGGQYEAGKIAAAERAKLPKDAVEIVEQLLVWLPNDLRLYWQLGELYNAQGDTKAALEVFENLVNSRGGRSPELREHRRILQSRPQAPAAPVGNVLPPFGSPSPADKGGGPPKGRGDDTGAWAPNPWQTLGVGFLAGALVALLGAWQIRELWRRRQPRTLEPRP